MRHLRFLSVLAAIVSWCVSQRTLADSYAPPTPNTVSSPTGNFLLRTLPPVRDGNTANWSKMTVIIYQLNAENQSYQEISRFETAEHPREIFINDTGTRIITFDHYFGMGGDRAIAVMDGSGKDLKTWKLSDIYAESVVGGFRTSTSNTFWRGKVWMGENDRAIWIAPPEDRHPGNSTKIPYLKLDLESLEVTKE